MKTLIVYATKHGTSARVAQRMQSVLQADCQKAAEVESISDYDTIVLGSGVYAGMLRKDMKAFVQSFAKELATKRVFFFLCGMRKEDCAKVLQENLGDELVQTIHYYDGIGGILNVADMSLMERTLIKAINKKARFIEDFKKDSYINLLDEARIAAFLQEVQK